MKRSLTITFFGFAIATFACREAYDAGYYDGRKSLKDVYEVRTEETEIPNPHMVEDILRDDIEELEQKLEKYQAIIQAHKLEALVSEN